MTAHSPLSEPLSPEGLARLRRDLHLDLATDVQPNTRLVLPDPVLLTPTAHWSNFGAGLEPFSLYVDNVSRVYLSGVLQGNASVANGETIIALPAGLRPHFQRSFTDNLSGQRIDITPAGLILYLGAAGSHVIGLDAISYRAFQ